MIRALQAIVFDFDGVIADSERLHLLSYRQVLAPFGLELSDSAYFGEYLGYDDAAVFRHYARNNGIEWDDTAVGRLIEAKTRRYEELSAEGEMLFPGAAAFITEAASVVPIAVASGALTHEVEDILQRTGLLELFVTVVGTDQTARSKPFPDPYLEAFARLADACGSPIDRSRTVAIEDSRWGLESAGAAGLRRVAVANTYSAAELAPHAELVVSGLETLTLSALDELCAT